MTRDELIAEIEDRGGSVPEEGTGADGYVTKSDLEAALENLDTAGDRDLDDGPRRGEYNEYLPAEYMTRKGNIRRDN